MNKIALLFFCIVSLISTAQTKIAGTSYSHFQLKNKKDTIDFVIADTNLNIKKPLLLFCQGSQPIPLFIKINEKESYPLPLSNFDIEKINKDYHVAVISMPKTPLIVGREHVNKQYNYITDSTIQYSYALEYFLADYSENYIQRANKVLKFLSKQDWIESNKMILVGHSQGARVAVGIAASNKKVTSLALFGYNPNGRIDQSIRKARKDAEKGKITWDKADSLQQSEYEFYRLIQNEDSIKVHPSLVSWKSFSKPTIGKLINLKIPVYIAYGSEDIGADLCDLLPLYFIETGKEDYKLRRYNNLEHNFFPVSEDGEIDYSKGNWKQVFNDFLNYLEK